MDNGAELIGALKQISREKGIDEEVIFEAIELSLVSACKKNYGTSQNIKAIIDRATGNVQVLAQKEVVEEVADANLEISVEDARKINIRYGLGDIVDIVVTPRNFGRISAQTAKQVVVQKFREAEREILYNEFITKEREIITGIVQRRDKKNVVVALGKLDAILPPGEQIPGEEYFFSQRLKVYVLEVKQTSKGPSVSISRTHPELVKRLFEQEVPEIYDGTVEIKSISREAGSRSKLAVHSKNADVDAVGACVGQNGYRVNIVVSELGGEKIDIINWSSDPRKYIAAALSPSRVLAVVTDEKTMSAKVVVVDSQLSLAIGKEGQNVRLAAKLTGWRIDIKSETQARTGQFISQADYLTDGDEAAGEQNGDDYDDSYEDDEYYDDEYGDDDDAEYDDEYDDNGDRYDDGDTDGAEYDDQYDDDAEYDDSDDAEYDDRYDDDEYDGNDAEYDDSQYDGEYDDGEDSKS